MKKMQMKILTLALLVATVPLATKVWAVSTDTGGASTDTGGGEMTELELLNGIDKEEGGSSIWRATSSGAEVVE